MRFCIFLFIVLISISTVAVARAETKEFSVTDFAQIAGEWEGSISVKQSGATFANALTIKMSGTWESPITNSCGLLSIADGKVRSQLLVMMNKPVPLSRNSIGTWTFFENEGKLSLKAERDDLSVTGQYTRTPSPGEPGARADAIDSGLLVGEWNGVIAASHFPMFTTPFYLTVTRASGRHVSGRMEWLSKGTMTATNFPFTGTLDGNVLTIPNPDIAFGLTIFGNRIVGSAYMGGNPFSIDVRKSGSVNSPVGCK